MRLLAVLALLALLLVVPAAAGQGPLGTPYTVSFELPAAPIKPEVESPTFEVVVDVRCDYVLAGASQTSPMEPVPIVDLQFHLTNGVAITGAPSVTVDPQACAAPPASQVTVRQPFQITIPRTAPGLQALPGNVKIHESRAPPGVPGSPEQTVPFTVTADYYSVSQVELPSKLEQCEGGKARYELKVTNFGNARTQYTFELGAEPSGKGWNAVLPPPLLLDSPNIAPANSSATVPFVVDCPLGNKEGAYQITIKPSSADDPTKTGNPITANVLARARGPLGIPGPGPLLLGLALLGVALLARRRA